MHPRVTIVPQPTPLQRLPRLSDALGIELFIKRDDLAGPTIGGNKSRQLEYYLGAAKAEGADTLLITGAVQSNFVRLAAATARAQGMQPVVQLEERVPGKGALFHSTGNVLLSRMLGAELMSYPAGEDENGADIALDRRAEELRAEGRTPYVIHLSETHPPLGALGYVDAAQEILAQESAFDFFVVGSGSGATHSGLLAGLRGTGSAAPVIGSCVRRAKPAQTARITRILERLVDLYPQAAAVVPDDDVIIWDGAFAPGYGLVGEPALAAMRLMAQTEGIILDPTYTAKAFAAIPALVETGEIPKGSRVCFIHTGGLAGLFAYSDTLPDQL